LGSQGSQANAVAVDGLGNAYLAGFTVGGSFPAVGGLQSCVSAVNLQSAFAAKFDSTGGLAFSTCFGNTAPNSSTATAVRLDAMGHMFLAGTTSDHAFPLMNPIDNKVPGSFIAEIDTVAKTLLFSTFIGADPAALQPTGFVSSLALDSTGNAYITGTARDGLPIFDALQPGFGGRDPNCGASEQCDPTSAFLVKISPAAGAAAATSPGLVNFTPPSHPVQAVGVATAAQDLTLVDLGTSVLTVSDIAVTGDFALHGTCTTVSASGGTCAVPLTFTPTAVGERDGTLTITDNSSGSPHVVKLVGQGGLAVASASPASLTFAGQAVGSTSVNKEIQEFNTGTAVLTVTDVQVTGDFSETTDCAAVRGNSGCMINVVFSPTASGMRSGTITITDNAANSPQTIPLTGTGTNGFSVNADDGADAATVSAGQTASYTLTINPGTGFSGSVQLTCTGAPAASTCTVSPNPLALGSTPTPITVSVKTTGAIAKVLPQQEGSPWSGRLALFAVGGVFGTLLLTGSNSRRRSRLLLTLAVAAIGASLSCGGGGSPGSGGGGGGGNPGTPAGNYTVTVTGTSGSVTQSIALMLKVQ
jgi:hypothetical protein